MQVRERVNSFIDKKPSVGRVLVDVTPLGGRRIFGGTDYRGYKLAFVGKSRATKKKEKRAAEEKFTSAQLDAFY